MWYRVEFNRDGSVRQSAAVEARGNDGGLVCYVDADSSTAAVKSALEWRRKYLEDSRRRRGKQRETAAKQGLCVSCLRGRAMAGKRRCRECTAKLTERWREPHVVQCDHMDQVTPQAVTDVLKKRYGKGQVSLDNASAALRGTPLAGSVTRHVAEALRIMGHEASTVKVTQGQRGGGRHHASDTELAILKVVKERLSSLTPAAFAQWLDNQILERETGRERRERIYQGQTAA